MPYADLDKRRSYKRKWNKLYYQDNRENDPVCIDFHHKGNKEEGVSELVYKSYSKKRIIEEINKCDILCANCHRKVHASE